MTRILLIDDDASFCSLVRRVLEGAGHDVDEAADGARGIAAFRRRPADLVLCDLFMPGTEGLETIRALRREFPDARVVAISGGAAWGAVDCLPVACALGAVQAMYKPFAMDTLLALIDGPPALGRSRTRGHEEISCAR
jgi:CheY-like chemotaxis protein